MDESESNREQKKKEILFSDKRKTRGFQIARHFLFRLCSVFIDGSAHMRHATLRRQRESNLDFKNFLFGIGAVSPIWLIFIFSLEIELFDTRNLNENRLTYENDWILKIEKKKKLTDRFRIIFR